MGLFPDHGRLQYQNDAAETLFILSSVESLYSINLFWTFDQDILLLHPNLDINRKHIISVS